MSRDIAPFGVRMPSDLKTYLEERAKANKRSLNAEIVDRLQETAKQDDTVFGYGGIVEYLAVLEDANTEDVEKRKEQSVVEALASMRLELLDAISHIKK